MEHENHDWGHLEDLYTDFGVSVKRVYLDRGKTYTVQAPGGFSSAVAITSGYGVMRFSSGVVRFSNTSIEIKPGRIIDAEKYKGRTYLLEATAASGLSFIETTTRISS
jgi:hypothetical protein